MSLLLRPTAAIGYVRVSTTMQAQEGHSIATQIAAIERYAEWQKLKLLKIYVDEAISGTSMENRPQLLEMLRDLKHGVVLVVHSMSRLARSTIDLLHINQKLQARGCSLVDLSTNIDTHTVTGKFTITLLGAIAEMENAQLKERVVHAMAYMRANGMLRTKPPFGWKYVSSDVDFEPDMDQQRTISHIAELKTQHPELSYAAIARHLTSNGYSAGTYRSSTGTGTSTEKTVKETKWSAAKVKNILLQNGIIHSDGTLSHGSSFESMASRVPLQYRALEDPVKTILGLQQLQAQDKEQEQETPDIQTKETETLKAPVASV